MTTACPEQLALDLSRLPEPELPERLTFYGETYEPKNDYIRLSRQAAVVWRLMRDATWRTLREISAATSEPEASVSARLRDFRRYGWTVDRRRRPGIDPKRGVWEYRLEIDR